jgi:deoxycytidylate deaminase
MAAKNLSKDPDTKVGACVVSPDMRQFSLGYNGFPVGVEETSERWQRPEKYLWVVHAEVNAVINAPFDTKGCSIYVTIQPCHICLGILKNAGIERIIYNIPYERRCNIDICKELEAKFKYVGGYDDEVLKKLRETF